MAAAACTDNCYEVLGVDSAASQAQIRTAYLKLAKVKHPDKSSDPGSKECFQKICGAFAQLRDPVLRAAHDRYHTIDAHVEVYGSGDLNCTIKPLSQSVRVDVPPTLINIWIDVVKMEYPDAPIKDRNQHGIQLTTSYSLSETKRGSVSLTFYRSTSVILVQGSAYLMWFEEHFLPIQIKVEDAARAAGAALEHTRRHRTRRTTSTQKHRAILPGSKCNTCNKPVHDSDSGGCWSCDLCNGFYHGLCAQPPVSGDEVCSKCTTTTLGDNQLTTNAIKQAVAAVVDKPSIAGTPDPHSDGQHIQNPTEESATGSRPESQTTGDHSAPVSLASSDTPGTPVASSSTDTVCQHSGDEAEVLSQDEVTPQKPSKPTTKAKQGPKTKSKTISSKVKKKDTKTQREIISGSLVSSLQKTVRELESKYVSLLDEVRDMTPQATGASTSDDIQITKPPGGTQTTATPEDFTETTAAPSDTAQTNAFPSVTIQTTVPPDYNNPWWQYTDHNSSWWQHNTTTTSGGSIHTTTAPCGSAQTTTTITHTTAALGDSTQTTAALGGSTHTTTALGGITQTTAAPGGSTQTTAAPGGSTQTTSALGGSTHTTTASGGSTQTAAALGGSKCSTHTTSATPESSQQRSGSLPARVDTCSQTTTPPLALRTEEVLQRLLELEIRMKLLEEQKAACRCTTSAPHTATPEDHNVHLGDRKDPEDTDSEVHISVDLPLQNRFNPLSSNPGRPKTGQNQNNDRRPREPRQRQQQQQQQQGTGRRDNTNDSAGSSRTDSEVDVLIISSSIGKAISAKKMYRNKTVRVKVLGKGKNIEDAKDFVSRTKTPAKLVVFLIGSNDVSDNKSVSKCQTELEELLSAARKTFGPSTELAVSQLLPRDDKDVYNRKAIDFNNRVASMCGKTSKLHFIAQPNLQHRNVRYDGIHLKPQGVATLVRNIKTVANPLIGLVPYQEYGQTSRPTEAGDKSPDEQRADHRDVSPQRNDDNLRGRTARLSAGAWRFGAGAPKDYAEAVRSSQTAPTTSNDCTRDWLPPDDSPAGHKLKAWLQTALTDVLRTL